MFRITDETKRMYLSPGPIRVSLDAGHVYSDYSADPPIVAIKAPPHDIQCYSDGEVLIEWIEDEGSG